MEKLVLEIVNLVEKKLLKTVTLKVCKNFMEKFSKTGAFAEMVLGIGFLQSQILWFQLLSEDFWKIYPAGFNVQPLEKLSRIVWKNFPKKIITRSNTGYGKKFHKLSWIMPPNLKFYLWKNFPENFPENLEFSLIKIKLVRNEIGFVIQTKVTSHCHVIEAPIPMSRESCVTWNIKFILECPEEKVAETGCLASDLYVFKTCKNRERKPAKEINGFYPHGTSCGNVMCSKQFFGFTWKTKTTKIVCECNNGRCGWSKPLHKCPTGNIEEKSFLFVRIELGTMAIFMQTPYSKNLMQKSL